jgi:hypothetical protein
VGRAKQSSVKKQELRTGDCFTPPRMPPLAFAMTAKDERLLHATSRSFAGVRNDGVFRNDGFSATQSHILKLQLNLGQELPSLYYVPQISPCRIHSVDQINFLLSGAAFDLLLSFDCLFNRYKSLVVHKFV